MHRKNSTLTKQPSWAVQVGSSNSSLASGMASIYVPEAITRPVDPTLSATSPGQYSKRDCISEHEKQFIKIKAGQADR